MRYDSAPQATLQSTTPPRVGVSMTYWEAIGFTVSFTAFVTGRNTTEGIWN